MLNSAQIWFYNIIFNISHPSRLKNFLLENICSNFLFLKYSLYIYCGQIFAVNLVKIKKKTNPQKEKSCIFNISTSLKAWFFQNIKLAEHLNNIGKEFADRLHRTLRNVT